MVLTVVSVSEKNNYTKRNSLYTIYDCDSIDVLLEKYPEYEFITQYETGAEAIAGCREIQADVVFLSLVEDMSVFDIAREIKSASPSTNFILCTPSTNIISGTQMISSGIRFSFPLPFPEELAIKILKLIASEIAGREK